MIHSATFVVTCIAAAADAEVQTASLRFFLPVTVAYLTACGGWLMLSRFAIAPRAPGPFPTTNRPWLDLAVAVATAVGIFALGALYNNKLLVPAGSAWVRHVTWAVNNLIIFSPIGIALALRRQGPCTILLPTDHIARRLLVGGALGVLATAVYLGLRGEISQLDDVIAGIIQAENLTNLLPVFLEGVALAFVFVRSRWVVGAWPSLMIAGMLFAAAHVPRQLNEGRGPGEMVAFFVLNTLLPAAILATVVRSRDVIWLGVVHYIMDIAIRAFD